MALTTLIEPDSLQRRRMLECGAAQFPGHASWVDSALQQRVQTTFTRFWQERLVSIEEPDAPLLRDFLAKPHFALQSMYRVEAESLAPTDPTLLGQAQVLFDLPESLLQRKLASLSNGELRRALIARAWMETPALIVLDDPLGGLDPEHRHTLVIALERISALGMPILLGLPDSDVATSAQGPAPEESGFPSTLTVKEILPGEVLVRLDAITVRFGETVVLSELDWTIRAGERWLLTGPNGAGKSTLLAFLTADHPQIYRNRVSLLGKIPGQGLNVWEHKAHIGFCSPELQHQWRMPGTLLAIACTGFSDPRNPLQPPLWNQRLAALEALQSLGLDPEADYAQSTYSAQRLALVARAMVHQSPLVLLDEPDQGLDEAGRRRLWDFIDRWSEQVQALVVATHHATHMPQCITHSLALPHRK